MVAAEDEAEGRTMSLRSSLQKIQPVERLVAGNVAPEATTAVARASPRTTELAGKHTAPHVKVQSTREIHKNKRWAGHTAFKSLSEPRSRIVHCSSLHT